MRRPAVRAADAARALAGKLMYACLKRHCTAVLMDHLDEYIERIVVKWLTTADVHTALHRPTNDRDASAARAEAAACAQEASMPPVLRGRIGKHAAREWAKLADNVAVRRDIIREIQSIELLKTEVDNRTFGPHRLRLAWTYGDAEATVPTAAPTAEASRAAKTVSRRPATAVKSATASVAAQHKPRATVPATTAPGDRSAR